MISCDLVGRCGNQMFQIAATFAHAKRIGVNYAIPKVSLCPAIWPTYFTHLPKSYVYLKKVYNEPSHAYSPIPLIDNIRLHGYFQSELYFKEYRNEVIDLFKIPYCFDVGAVGIHVRRGDYLEMQEKHPVITEDYLTESIRYFLDKGFDLFRFFSDDPMWCYGYCKKTGLTADVITGNNPIKDLSMLSSCEHQIISNSSFSWWASWLNRNTQKIVITPKKWFGEGNNNLDTSTLIPDTWIRI